MASPKMMASLASTAYNALMHDEPPFNRISYLYHFTDSRNLQSIRDNNGLYSTSRLRSKGLDGFYPGGNEVSLETDERLGMHNFVHLCFNRQHPLSFLAKQRGQIEKISWLLVKPDVLDLPGVLFCPGVSNRNDAQPVPIAEAADLIDFDILYTWMDWKNDPELRARRVAAELCEVLVPNRIPFRFFSEYFPNG